MQSKLRTSPNQKEWTSFESHVDVHDHENNFSEITNRLIKAKCYDQLKLGFIEIRSTIMKILRGATNQEISVFNPPKVSRERCVNMECSI